MTPFGFGHLQMASSLVAALCGGFFDQIKWRQ